MNRFRTKKPSYWFSQSHNGKSAFIHWKKETTVYHHISKITQSVREMQMLPALWIIGLSALFHTSDGKYVPKTQANAQFEKRHNACDQKTLGHFAIPRRKRHYASHIYILFNICQTFINYKLMKCSTVLGDRANEDIDFCFWHIFVRFNTILSITLY